MLLTAGMVIAGSRVASAQPPVVLYTQTFENPTGFVNDGGDLNVFRTVNQLYGNQPAGFAFSQNFTVETLRIGGSQAFGNGYRDPQGVAGTYALGLLSDAENDFLGLAFNVGAYNFLNFRLDISPIDVSTFGGPFVTPSSPAPTFRFSLFDNPTAALGLGSGTLLSFAEATAPVRANPYTFNWKNVVVGLSAAGNTNGNVILRVDLLSGGYAGMDNFVVAASNVSGEIPPINAVPEPSTYALMVAGLAAVGAVSRRRRVIKA
jgi:hypothetical protein